MLLYVHRNRRLIWDGASVCAVPSQLLSGRLVKSEDASGIFHASCTCLGVARGGMFRSECAQFKFKCCFTSTKTVRTTRAGHLYFHTALSSVCAQRHYNSLLHHRKMTQRLSRARPERPAKNPQAQPHTVQYSSRCTRIPTRRQFTGQLAGHTAPSLQVGGARSNYVSKESRRAPL